MALTLPKAAREPRGTQQVYPSHAVLAQTLKVIFDPCINLLTQCAHKSCELRPLWPCVALERCLEVTNILESKDNGPNSTQSRLRSSVERIKFAHGMQSWHRRLFLQQPTNIFLSTKDY